MVSVNPPLFGGPIITRGAGTNEHEQWFCGATFVVGSSEAIKIYRRNATFYQQVYYDFP